jgi:hypothetical protein
MPWETSIYWASALCVPGAEEKEIESEKWNKSGSLYGKYDKEYKRKWIEEIRT